MYNKQLDTFLKVAENGSFSKAAQALYISPAAVIQQINSLEQNLQAVLFERTRHGVTLTDAGRYFQGEVISIIGKDREIRQKLAEFTSSEKTLCVGISMMQKVRLLFDLWVLYSGSDKSQDIRLINAEPGNTECKGIDIYEGASLGFTWQKEWDFFKICDVPIGIGIPRGHQLAQKRALRIGEMKGHTVLIPGSETSPQLLLLGNTLRSHGVIVREITDYNMSVLWECSCNLYLLAAPMCMQDVLSGLEMKSCSGLGAVPYGFFTSRPAAPVAEAFVAYAKGIYNGSIDAGIVPVLD